MRVQKNNFWVHILQFVENLVVKNGSRTCQNGLKWRFLGFLDNMVVSASTHENLSFVTKIKSLRPCSGNL